MTKPSYANTYWPELVYNRSIPQKDEGLPNLDFDDLEPLDLEEVVGVHPHEAILSMPAVEMVGCAPFAAVALLGDEYKFDREEAGRLDYRDEDMIRTEEYDRYDITGDEGIGIW